MKYSALISMNKCFFLTGFKPRRDFLEEVVKKSKKKAEILKYSALISMNKFSFLRGLNPVEIFWKR